VVAAWGRRWRWVIAGSLALMLQATACGKLRPFHGRPAAAPANRPINRSSFRSQRPSQESLGGAAPSSHGIPQVDLVARGFGAPDDVVVAPDGTIIFSDLAGGIVARIPAGARAAEPIARGLSVPEGIVVLRDGRLIVAEQGRNRLLSIDPRSGSVRPLVALANPTRYEGVDGIGWDAEASALLVPDSPDGRVLDVSPDGRTVRVVAEGMHRPTGAARLASGALIVVDETGGTVVRFTGDGSGAVLARVVQPDDVVVGPDGEVLVNALDGDVREITPQARTIVAGLGVIHGLAVAPDGSLVVTDQRGNRILRIRNWEGPPGGG
jgi:sugar lactone lactonase YvrE